MRVNRLRFLWGAAFLLFSSSLLASNLKPDEQNIYFPTDASRNENGTWQIPVHGWIFESEHDSLWRQGTVIMLKQSLGLNPGSELSSHLQERGWPFLVDNERGKKISVRIHGNAFLLPPSVANGHFYHEVTLEADFPEEIDERWHHFDTVMSKGDSRQFHGAAQILNRRVLLVVSDVDGTIELSNVLDKQELLANTFSSRATHRM